MNNQNIIKPLNPSDLMIGNLVLDSTKNTTVVENIVRGDNRVRYGIPLTEEWLLRFGGKSTDMGVLIELKRGCVMSLNILLKSCIVNVSGCFGLVTPCHIEYVHQLQNLYYLLTGEKLKGGK